MERGKAHFQPWLLSLLLILPSSSVFSDAFVMFKHPQQLHPDRVLILVSEIENCSFCDRVKQDFLLPLSLSPQWSSLFQVARVDLNSPQILIDFSGQKLSQQIFATRLGADFSPTLIFLNPISGERIGEDIVGLVTPDFYGFYLQQQISLSNDLLTELQ